MLQKLIYLIISKVFICLFHILLHFKIFKANVGLVIKSLIIKSDFLQENTTNAIT